MGKFKRAWHGIVAIEVIISLAGLAPVGGMGGVLAIMLDIATPQLLIFFGVYAVNQVIFGIGLAYYRRKREERYEKVLLALNGKIEATDRLVSALVKYLDLDLHKK